MIGREMYVYYCAAACGWFAGRSASVSPIAKYADVGVASPVDIWKFGAQRRSAIRFRTPYSKLREGAQ
jgi:hypothetical protein